MLKKILALSLLLCANASATKIKVDVHNVLIAAIVVKVKDTCLVETFRTAADKFQLEIRCEDKPSEIYSWDLNSVGKGVKFVKAKQSDVVRLEFHKRDGIDWSKLNATDDGVEST